MITQIEIDEFYAFIDTLGLRFPVAEISRATGEPKANVSRYLSRKLNPSESFLNRFYRQFPKSYKNVPRGGQGKSISSVTKHEVNYEKSDVSKSLEIIRVLTDSNNRLAVSIEKLTSQITNSGGTASASDPSLQKSTDKLHGVERKASSGDKQGTHSIVKKGQQKGIVSERDR